MERAVQLLDEAGRELERAIALAEDPRTPDDSVRAAAAAATRLALQAALRDRGLNAVDGLDPPALAALLQEAALRPPQGVAELLAGSPGRGQSMTAAMAAVAWAASSLRVT